MSARLLQGLLLFPQPLLTLAHLIAVSTYQVPPSRGPVLALAVLPALALLLEPVAGRRSWLAVGVAVGELAWAGAAAAIVAATARHAAAGA